MGQEDGTFYHSSDSLAFGHKDTGYKLTVGSQL